MKYLTLHELKENDFPFSILSGFRLRLHFNGYASRFDFWEDQDSPHIFPAGWARSRGLRLAPPPNQQGPVSSFDWGAHLKTVGAQAAPVEAFPMRQKVEI